MFKIEIVTENDAFQEDCRGELARILEDFIDDIYKGKEPSMLYDYNGNKVGKVTWGI